MSVTCTVVLLIRHGRTDAVRTRLVSRLPGVHLSDEGRAEVERLREALAGQHLDAVYASPLERTRETAAPLAADRAIDVRLCDGLIEVEFGEWTGRTFAELDRRSDWRRFSFITLRRSATSWMRQRLSAISSRRMWKRSLAAKKR